jgi:hypothetical protein
LIPACLNVDYIRRSSDEQMAEQAAEQAAEEAAHKHHRRTPRIPDADGERWCRACQARLPVSAFPAGKRLYLCRQHLWQRFKKPHMDRVLGDTGSRHAYRLWRRCWEDAKLSFGQPRVALTRRHITGMLGVMEGWKTSGASVCEPGGVCVPNDRGPGDGVLADCVLADRVLADRVLADRVLADISAHAAIVPADPARLLAPDNAVVVGMAARTALLRVCKTGGHAQYVKALGEMASSRRPTVW